MPDLPDNPVYTALTHVYVDRFIDHVHRAVNARDDKAWDAARLRMNGQTLETLSSGLGVSRETGRNLLARFSASLSSDTRDAAALFYNLVQDCRSRCTSGCWLSTLEDFNPWLAGIAAKPDLIAFTLQHLLNPKELPEPLAVIDFDGRRLLAGLNRRSFDAVCDEWRSAVMQLAFMGYGYAEINEWARIELNKSGHRDLLEPILAEAFEDLLFAPATIDSPHADRLVATGSGDEARIVAVLRIAGRPLAAEGIQELAERYFHRTIKNQRISKFCNDWLVPVGYGRYALVQQVGTSDKDLQAIRDGVHRFFEAQKDGAVFGLKSLCNAIQDGEIDAPKGLGAYNVALALRASPLLAQVLDQGYALDPSKAANSRWQMRLKAEAWVRMHLKPITTNVMRELFPESRSASGAPLLSGDDVMIRVRHGAYWVFGLDMPNGTLHQFPEPQATESGSGEDVTHG